MKSSKIFTTVLGIVVAIMILSSCVSSKTICPTYSGVTKSNKVQSK